MESLVDLKGISDVANNVINKISSATSWIVTRDTPEKIAINTYIDEIKNSNLSAPLKAACIYNAKKTIKEYANQNSIVQKAISMLSEEDHAEEIEDDWVASYMDKARLISDENVQLIWAKILAGEAEKPGSYSLRTLDTLRNISKKEAEIFQKAARLSIHQSGRCILCDNDSLLQKHGLSFADLLILGACGLINLESLNLTMQVGKDIQEAILFNKNIVGIIKPLDESKELVNISVYVFSKSGRELLQAISSENDDSYLIEVLKIIKEDSLSREKKVQVTVHKIERFEDDGLINYDERDLIADETDG